VICLLLFTACSAAHLFYFSVKCCPNFDGFGTWLDEAIGFLELSSHLQQQQQQRQQ
jgi:hypothetical protein